MTPRTLRIKGHKFTVQQVGRKDLPKDSNGVCDYDKNLIRLYRRLPPSRKLEILFHEVFHAMLDSHKIAKEEEVCTLLGEQLVQVIRDNPDLIRHALAVLRQ